MGGVLDWCTKELAKATLQNSIVMAGNVIDKYQGIILAIALVTFVADYAYSLVSASVGERVHPASPVWQLVIVFIVLFSYTSIISLSARIAEYFENADNIRGVVIQTVKTLKEHDEAIKNAKAEVVAKILEEEKKFGGAMAPGPHILYGRRGRGGNSSGGSNNSEENSSSNTEGSYIELIEKSFSLGFFGNMVATGIATIIAWIAGVIAALVVLTIMVSITVTIVVGPFLIAASIFTPIRGLLKAWFTTFIFLLFWWVILGMIAAIYDELIGAHIMTDGSAISGFQLFYLSLALLFLILSSGGLAGRLIMGGAGTEGMAGAMWGFMVGAGSRLISGGTKVASRLYSKAKEGGRSHNIDV